jgi:hypothetical protein
MRKETILITKSGDYRAAILYSNIKIRKEDNTFKEVTIFANYLSLNEITFR